MASSAYVQQYLLNTNFFFFPLHFFMVDSSVVCSHSEIKEPKTYTNEMPPDGGSHPSFQYIEHGKLEEASQEYPAVIELLRHYQSLLVSGGLHVLLFIVGVDHVIHDVALKEETDRRTGNSGNLATMGKVITDREWKTQQMCKVLGHKAKLLFPSFIFKGNTQTILPNNSSMQNLQAQFYNCFVFGDRDRTDMRWVRRDLSLVVV